MSELETIVGPLTAYRQLVPGTFLSAAQLMAEQVRDHQLRNHWFFSSDAPLYSLEGENRVPTLWLGVELDSPLLERLANSDDAYYEQLEKSGNYRPTREEAARLMSSELTLRINLTKLRLKGDKKEWRYLEINTKSYENSLNAEGRLLAERFYGEGEVFGTVMKTLKEEGISKTRVCVLSPDYVREHAKDGSIGRAVFRSGFDYDAFSCAVNRFVDVRVDLRGVSRASAIEQAPEERRRKK